MDIVKNIYYVIIAVAAIVLYSRLISFITGVSEWRNRIKKDSIKKEKQSSKYTFVERITLYNMPIYDKCEFALPHEIDLRIKALYDEVRDVLKNEGKWKRNKAFYRDIYKNCRFSSLGRFFMIPCPDEGENNITQQIRKIINEKCQMVVPLSDDDMRRFYYFNPSAWEYRYNHLKKNFAITGAEPFFKGIRCLGDHLTAITTIRKIYYEMHEKMIEHDPVLSLRFYLLYYYNALKLSKPLNIKRANRKLLFKNTHQEQTFEKMCEEIKIDKKRLDEMLESVASIYVRERKKLCLDEEGIKDTDQKQARIAETLATYLSDEEISNAEVLILQQQQQASVLLPNDCSNTAMELFALFKCNDFNLDKQKVNIFAQAKGVMPGQLVESLNEKYYDILDDVLIEEGDSCYTIERDYYEQIKEQNGS